MDQLKGGIKLKKVNNVKQNQHSHLFRRDDKFPLQAPKAPPLEKPLFKSNAQDDIMKCILQGASRLRKAIVLAGDENK